MCEAVSSPTIKHALDYLFARTTGGFKFGLERTVELLAASEIRERRIRRSTSPERTGREAASRRWRRCWRAKGLRVATYTSPHLVDFRERMVVGGEPIPADDVVEFVTRHTAARRGDRRELLRGDDRDGVRLLRARRRRGRRHRSGTRRPARFDERVDPDRRRRDVDRARSHRVPRLDARGDRRREGRDLQARARRRHRRDAIRAFATLLAERARAAGRVVVRIAGRRDCDLDDVASTTRGTACDDRVARRARDACARRSPAAIRRRISRSRSSCSTRPAAFAVGLGEASRASRRRAHSRSLSARRPVHLRRRAQSGRRRSARADDRGRRAAASRSPSCSACCATRIGAR